ncbi:MAG: hypothetical protein C0483_12485 [Pirellula sp.]|nr:hypothetical protein [Pirellula sp.]
MPTHIVQPVVVIGAGINGAAAARELALSGLDVVVVDAADIASGTTAYSSRLVHGGLRYLEYADTALVRESLAERERLVTLAPDFVRPMEFRVPVERRLGGFVDGLGKLLLGGKYKPRSRRGLWVVRFGLWWYDLLAAGSSLPKSHVIRIGTNFLHPPAKRYHWLCAYSDAQMRYPEQFTVALLADARRAAEEQGSHFTVHNYARVEREGKRLRIFTRAGAVEEFEPAAVVNAGGPWGDDVTQALGCGHRRLLSGTKGSHIVVFRDDIRRTLDGAALYAEASDGRPVFIIPFGEATLIGTTDLPYEGDPATAVASEAEIDYLLDLAGNVLPSCPLTRGDVTLHYSGVRPLPFTDASTPAAITRRHAIVEHPDMPWPTLTLVGGKLTTCRSLAEETAGAVWKKLLGGPTSKSPTANSRTRPIPPALANGGTITDERRVVGADLSRGFVREVIRTQWVHTLDDLIERRLMLLFARELRRATLEELAELLVEERVLAEGTADKAVAQTSERLRAHFGRTVE